MDNTSTSEKNDGGTAPIKPDNMNYDAIVIGSGIGGLVCAASLAFCNKKVLLLEQYDQVGGCLRCLSHEKWNWIRGFQYAGSILPDNKDFVLLNYLTDNQVNFRKLANDFQKVKTPEYEFTLFSGFNMMQTALIEEFPQEKQAIEAYMNKVCTIGKMFATEIWAEAMPLLQPHTLGITKFRNWFEEHIDKEMLATQQSVIDSMFQDKKLKFMLSSYWSSIGLPPETAPFSIAAGVQYSLLHDVYAPVNMDIAERLKTAIQKRGGEVRTGQNRGKARTIMFEEMKAVGVTTMDGKSMKAPFIISDVGIKNTVSNLIPPENCTETLKEASELASSYSALVLRLGFDKNILKYTDGNRSYRYMSKTPFSLAQSPLDADWAPPNTVIAFQFPEPTEAQNAGFAVELMLLTEFSHFEKFKDIEGAEYLKAKKKICDDLIEKVLLQWFPPEIKAYIQYMELDTPIDIKNSTLHYQGAIFGLACTKPKITDSNILPQSGISGLYFTGADVIADGTMPCLTTGVLVAGDIVKMDLINSFYKEAQSRNETIFCNSEITHPLKGKWLAECKLEIFGVTSAVKSDFPQPFVVLGNRLYTVFVKGNTIHTAWSPDGESWTKAYANIENVEIKQAPALAVFKGKLYCTWNGDPQSGLFYSVYNTKAWSSPMHINGTENCIGNTSTSLAADEDRLYCACLQANKTTINLIVSHDGLKWNENEIPVLTDINSGQPPTIACYSNQLFCAWYDQIQEVVCYAVYNGKAWAKPKPLDALKTFGNAAPPVLFATPDKLYCARGNSHWWENQIAIVSMQNNDPWHSESLILLNQEIHGIALAGFKNKLFCSWVQDKDKETRISFTYTPQMIFSDLEKHWISSPWSRSEGPAMVVFNDTLFCSYLIPGSDTSSIQLIYTTDGQQWQNAAILEGVKTKCAPALTVYKGKLFCAWNNYNEGISYSLYANNTWSAQQCINLDQCKAIGDQSPFLVVFQSKLYCIWTDSDNRIGFASTRDTATWYYEDQLNSSKVETELQPAATVFGNLLLCAWNGENDKFKGLISSCFTLPNTVGDPHLIAGAPFVNGLSNTLKQQPPILMSVNEALYCAFQCTIGKQPYLTIMSSLNSIDWKYEAFISLSEKGESNENSDLNSGVPAMAFFKGKLYVAWNHYTDKALAFASATVSGSFKAKFRPSSTEGQKVVDFINFTEGTTPGNVGVCVSGGSARAAMAAMGQLRGLKYLKTDDGVPLLSQVKALSSVSGGTWLAGTYTYLNSKDISDDDFLNYYEEDRSQLVVSDPDNTRPVQQVLDKLPQGNFGQCIASDAIYFPTTIASIFQLYQQNRTSLGTAWQTVMGQILLERYTLYSGGDREPNSSYTYSTESKEAILEANSDLLGLNIHLYPEPEEDKRLRRPLWISNFAMLTNNDKPDQPLRKVVPVQSTPFYTGVFASPPEVVDNNNHSIGGGCVETFAFNSIPGTKGSDTNTVYQKRPFSLADSIGTSSSFFVDPLMGPNQFSTTAKDSQSKGNALIGVLGMVDSLSLEDIFQGLIQLLVEQKIKPPVNGSEGHGLDEMGKMAIEILTATGLDTKLKDLGINDINQVITVTFHYFQVRFPNLNLMTGLKDAGTTAGILLLVPLLIEKLTALFKDSIPFIVGKIISFIIGPNPVSLISEIISGTENGLKIYSDVKKAIGYVETALQEVIPMIHEVIPRYCYWSVRDPDPVQNWEFQASEFCDGGILENYGINNMLTFTDIDNILCFINSDPIQIHAGSFDPQLEGNAVITSVEIDANLPPLFGYHPYNEAKGGYFLYDDSDITDLLYKNNQVFPSQKFYELLCGLLKSSGSNFRQKSANFKQGLTTMENTFFGVKGGRKVTVLWSYLNYVQHWVDGLSPEVQKQVKAIKDFPNYFMGFTQNTHVEINLLSGLTAWNVAGEENCQLFMDMFQSQEDKAVSVQKKVSSIA